MGIVSVAVIKKNDSKIGYRLLDINSGEVKDVPIRSVEEQLRRGIKIENLYIQNGTVKFKEGCDELYGCISENNGSINKMPLYIIDKMGDKYRVCSADGRISVFNKEYIMQYCKEYGIANAILRDEDVRELRFNIDNKRFVVVNYEGCKDYLRKCKSLTFLDTITGKLMTRADMFRYRHKTESQPVYESIWMEDGEYKMKYNDIYDIRFSETIVEGSRFNQRKDFDIILGYREKDGEVQFRNTDIKRCNYRAEYDKWISLSELMYNIERSKGHIGVDIQYIGDTIKIATETGVYVCKREELDSSKEKHHKLYTIKNKMSLMNKNVLIIDKYGVLNEINTKEMEEYSYRIPSGIQDITDKVMFDNYYFGNQYKKLVVPSTIQRIIIKNIRDRYKQYIQWGCLECHTDAILECIKGMDLNKLWGSRDNRSKRLNITSELRLGIKINEIEFLKFICWLKSTVIISNELDGKKILDETIKLCNKAVKDINKEHSKSIRDILEDRFRLGLYINMKYDKWEYLGNLSSTIGVLYKEDETIGKIKSITDIIASILNSVDKNIYKIKWGDIDYRKELNGLLNNINSLRDDILEAKENTLNSYRIRIPKGAEIYYIEVKPLENRGSYSGYMAIDLEDNYGKFTLVFESTSYIINGYKDKNVEDLMRNVIKVSIDSNNKHKIIHGGSIRDTEEFRKCCRGLGKTRISLISKRKF